MFSMERGEAIIEHAHMTKAGRRSDRGEGEIFLKAPLKLTCRCSVGTVGIGLLIRRTGLFTWSTPWEGLSFE